MKHQRECSSREQALWTGEAMRAFIRALALRRPRRRGFSSSRPAGYIGRAAEVAAARSKTGTDHGFRASWYPKMNSKENRGLSPACAVFSRLSAGVYFVSGLVAFVFAASGHGGDSSSRWARAEGSPPGPVPPWISARFS